MCCQWKSRQPISSYIDGHSISWQNCNMLIYYLKNLGDCKHICVCVRARAPIKATIIEKGKKKSATNAIKNSKSEKLNEYYHQMLKCSYKNYNIMLLEKTKWIAKLKPQNIHNPAGPHMPEKDSYFTAFSDWKSLACDRTDFRDWEAHAYKQMLPLS